MFADNIKDVVSGNRMSRAFTGSLILGNASPNISLSSTRASTPSSSASSRTGTPPSDVERCGCCNVDDFWKMYNAFRLMDKRGCGSVRRCDFYEASTEHVTLEMRRTMTRGDLHERFRSSAADMTFMELLERIWPLATDADKKMMRQWAKLYDASLFLSSDSFQGTHHDLKQIFDLLDLDGSQTLSMSELVRARILTKDEAQQLLKDWHKEFSKNESSSDSQRGSGQKLSLSLGFSDFCILVQKPLTEKYAQKQEEGLPNDSWDIHCRFAFQASKRKTRETVRSVGTRIKAVNALGGPFGFPRRTELNQESTLTVS